MKESKRKKLITQLKKLYGLPPYDGASNIVAGDGYFAKSIRGDKPIEEIIKATGFDKILEDWEKTRQEFIDKH
jgi:hypothetical protein